MGKSIPDAIIDLMLAESEGTQIHLCSAEPANYAGIAAVALGGAAISGAYTKANGDVSGRKNTLPAQSAIPITADGTCNHVAISNNTDTLYQVTTCAAQGVTNGGTADTTAYDHEIGDPT